MTHLMSHAQYTLSSFILLLLSYDDLEPYFSSIIIINYYDEYPTTIPLLPGTIISPYCPISCAGALPLSMCSFMNHLFRSINGIFSGHESDHCIAWPCQSLSQSLWLYYHYQWCNFMNHLFRSLNGILISPGFMIHLNICGNINNVKYYWNHVSYDIVASSFS